MAYKWQKHVTGYLFLEVNGCELTVERVAPGRNGVSWYTSCPQLDSYGEWRDRSDRHVESGGADTLAEGKRQALSFAGIKPKKSRRG